MKQILLIISILTSVSVYSQSESTSNGNFDISAQYQPLLQEGKEWTLIHYALNCDRVKPETHQVLTVSVDCTENIDGKECKRLKIECERPGEGETEFNWCGICIAVEEGISYKYLYEEDGKIFVYRNPGPYYAEGENWYGEPTTVVKYGEPYFDLYIDQNYGLGDFMPGIGTISKEEYIEYGPLTCRTLSTKGVQWIEGIGSPDYSSAYDPYYDPNLELPTNGSKYKRLICCKLDGNPLFDETQKYKSLGLYTGDIVSKVEAIESIVSEADQNKSDTLYNLQGIKVNNPVKGQIYICNGHKVIY